MPVGRILLEETKLTLIIPVARSQELYYSTYIIHWEIHAAGPTSAGVFAPPQKLRSKSDGTDPLDCAPGPFVSHLGIYHHPPLSTIISQWAI